MRVRDSNFISFISSTLYYKWSQYEISETDVTSRFDQVFWLGDFNFRVEERHGVVEKFLRQCEDDDDPSYEVRNSTIENLLTSFRNSRDRIISLQMKET